MSTDKRFANVRADRTDRPVIRAKFTGCGVQDLAAFGRIPGHAIGQTWRDVLRRDTLALPVSSVASKTIAARLGPRETGRSRDPRGCFAIF